MSGAETTRAIMTRKALWEYVRRKSLSKVKKAQVIEELKNHEDGAPALLRKALQTISAGGP